ncbi:tetratricopeptide repeat protein [Streptomyces sp. CA-106110]|uniref:tetratricopeptide repeat protein n=1 Tax=Streptomyces sp. CA-106110 TaxID=3240044 RepID=UPI003D94C2CC
MSLAIGHLVTQYQACVTAATEPFSEAVASLLEELCTQLGEAADSSEQLVFDDPAIVLGELGRVLVCIADAFAEAEQYDDELLARRVAVDLHADAGTLQHTRYLSALAGPLVALGRIEEALEVRREAFGVLCELAMEDAGCWLDAVAEAEAYADLLAEAGDLAAAVTVCRQAVDGLAPHAASGHAWAAVPYAQAVRWLAQRSADAGDPVAALALAKELVALLKQQGGGLVEVADAVRMVGLRHQELEHWDEACAHLAEAIEFLADVAENTEFCLRRAELLADLSRVQAHLDGDSAVQTAQQCVDLYRSLVREDPDHLPRLALALVQLHHRLAEMGRHIKAVYAAQEAAALYRRLNAIDAEWTSELAHAHLHAGRQLAHIGRHEPALEETQMAVELLRDHPGDPFDLGLALKDLGTRLHDVRRLEESLAATGEAVETFRVASELPALGATLCNLAITHNVADQVEETVRAATEAVETYQRLYDEDSNWAFGLAHALGLLGRAFERTDRFDQAITATERAVSLLERLDTPGNDDFALNLAGILHDLSRYHEEQGRLERALEHMRRSVSLYGELTQRDPERFHGQLASAWLSLGIYLGRLGQAEEAQSATGFAVDLYRQADDRESLALALSQLASREHVLDHDEESTTARSEAIELYEEFALEQPERHGANLAKALEDLAAYHSGKQDYSAALPLLERAADLWERLGDQDYLAGNLRRRLLVECCLDQDTEDTLERLIDAQQDLDRTIRTLDAAVQELIRLGHLPPAEQLLTRAFGLWEIHLLEHPDSAPVVRLILLDSRALVLARNEQYTEAVTIQDQTVQLLEPLALDSPAGYLGILAAARSRLADYLRAADRPTEALDHQHQVVSAYEQLAARDPGHYRPALVSSLHDLGRLLSDLGHTDADAVLARAATLRLTLEREED